MGVDCGCKMGIHPKIVQLQKEQWQTVTAVCR